VIVAVCVGDQIYVNLARNVGLPMTGGARQADQSKEDNRQGYFLKQVSRFSLPMTSPITGRGMNLAGMLPSSFNDRACSDRLRLAGLDVPPLLWYAVGLTPPGLLFGLAAFDKRAIQHGVARMAVALDGKGARLSNRASSNACRARMSAAMATRRVNFDSSVTRVDFFPKEESGTTITNPGHASLLPYCAPRKSWDKLTWADLPRIPSAAQ
jgi:hypothetical protein